MENRFKVFKAIKEDELWFIDEDEKLMVNNPKFHIGSYITDQNNKRVYFTRCRSLNSSSVQCAIYTAEIEEGGEILNVYKLNEEVNYPGYTNTQPCIYINEEGKKALLFVSDRPGGYGKMDLWMSILDKESNAAKAVNLGSDINTLGNELTPFFYERNHRLYFSSDWHAGIGGLDVFYTIYDIDNDEYKSPVNMGVPINSPYNDLSFIMKKDSNGGFLASNRDDAFFINEEHCCHDLYDYNILKKIKIETEEPSYDSSQNILVLKGIVKDAKTKKRLISEIELVNNNNGKLLEKIKTKQGKGNYMMILPSGGNYGITASSPGYLFHSENLIIEAVEGFKEVNKDIDLKRIEVGSSIILNNIFFDFDQSTLRDESYTELERLYELLINNAKLIIEISGHTDNKGSRSYNKRLSLNRAKTVVNYLIKKGIDKKRLNYKGYGFDKPIAENETERGRQMNRRTEFKITGK
jgi:outer membrane protein OmpA-like peptidoglycan-associated protein